MSEAQRVALIRVPNDWNAFEREQFAKQAINKILERTDQGLDINGNKFASYSDSYASSLDFKNAGKSKGEVNLRLTNEMMDSLGLISHGPGEIYLGYRQGTAANDKAAWNEASDNGPSRKFLGIAERDLNQMVSAFEAEQGVEARRTTIPEARRNVVVTQRVLDRIFSSLFTDMFEGDDE